MADLSRHLIIVVLAGGIIWYVTLIIIWIDRRLGRGGSFRAIEDE